MPPTLSELKTLAIQAGQILRAGYGEQFEVHSKGRIDVVTEIDHRSETFLVEQIRSLYPGHTIITEEAGLLEGFHNHCWYIDPLDGTINYAHGIPIFAISIAYAEQEQVKLGVIYDPLRDECFSAERGKGAWLNGRPLHVSATNELLRSLLVTGFPYEMHGLYEQNLELFARLSRLSQGVRRLGSAALDLSYVACGRLEGFWELTLMAWDIAAGSLLVEEAGGIVTNARGDPDYMKPPHSILAANPAIHPLLLAELVKEG